MSKFYGKNYWLVGFKSRLYDFLSPESYFESMRRVIEYLPDHKNLNLLDAGCGTGKILHFLVEKFQKGLTYTGLDILDSAVNRTLNIAKILRVGAKVNCLKRDLISPFTMAKKFDVVIAHFSIYTLGCRENRLLALKNLKTVMNTGCILILVNPSKDYDVDVIIDDSIRIVREKRGVLPSLVKKYFVYPITKSFGLNFIQKQLKSSEWKAYTRDEFLSEIDESGFSLQKIEKVYSGSAFLGIVKLID